MTRSRTRTSARRTLVACIAALVCASVAYRVVRSGNLEHSSLVFIGIPALLALALTAIQPKSGVGTINTTIAIALCLSGILFGEGFICILMASPLFFLFGTILGKISDSGKAPGNDEATPPATRWKHGIILLAPFYLEGVLPGYEWTRDESVTVSRVLPAGADAVRASLASPMRFDRRLPALFRLGFPTPGRTGGSGLDVGDHRSIEFLHGGHHPGTLQLEITKSEPGAVGFAAVSDDSYVTHWLSWRSAEVQWREIGPGRTRVTWTLRYARRLDPAFYFKPLERYGVSLAAGYLTETLATPGGAGALTMDRALAVRMISLYAPAVLVALAWALRPPGRRRATAALLACGWSLPSLLLVNVLAQRIGWWRFAPGAGAVAGVPGDLLLGWTLLWGAVPVLLMPKAPLVAIVATLAALDLAAMPLAEPVVRLGGSWLPGEGVAIAAALIPAQLLARWTWRDRRVGVRAAMQAAAFSATLLWICPELIFLHTAGTWTHLLDTWNAYGGVHLQLALIPAVMGLSAVQEFAERGRGTPVPFDPPRRLVTSGPYAYVANPMQLSMVLVLTCWGLIIGSAWMALAGPISLAYSVGLAAWDEESDLHDRFGAPWRSYRRQVRSWIPRLRPYHASVDSEGEPALDARAPFRARLYVAASCGPCSEVAAWFAARHPRGLEIVPAELHPSRDLRRITYDAGDGGGEEEGVAAVARALEHVHLGWALLGWTIRLPIMRPVLQLVVDASGGEPRTVVRSGKYGTDDQRSASITHFVSSLSCPQWEVMMSARGAASNVTSIPERRRGGRDAPPPL